MKTTYSALVGLTAAAMLSLGVTGTASAEVTLKGASCFPIGSPPSRPYEAVVKTINERGKGLVKIEMVGGAPAIGGIFDITRRAARGTYDIIGCTEAYFGNVIKEAPVFRLSEHSYADLRKNGGLQMLADLLAKKKIHYVGRHHDFGQFHLWLSPDNPIDKADLTGLNLRTAAVYTAFFRSLGATTQTAPLPEIYQLMESKTVQGFGWPASGWVPTWAEVTGYKVNPGFYTSPLHTMLNLKKWNSLSAEVQKLITDVVMEFEERSEPGGAQSVAQLKKEDDYRASKGMKVINLEGAEGEKFARVAKEAAWAEVLERSPKNGPKLMELFTK